MACIEMVCWFVKPFVSTLIEKLFSSIRESVQPHVMPYLPYGVEQEESMRMVQMVAIFFML